MRLSGPLAPGLLAASLLACTTQQPAASKAEAPVDATQMMVRVAEVDLEPSAVADYLAILREEAATSVRVEPGVLAIFPMQERDAGTHIRIVEIYASRAAYEAHLKTPHFLHYKTATLPMVKSLRLVEMTAVDPEVMPLVFSKMAPPPSSP